ncbi:DUF4388 domain-containing protein [Myxococcota bacterium]|nr:DUF4388 domain-containing protein [Myxococcota bacterium]
MHRSMLFLPPEPPIPLEPGEAVRIGRGQDCDLRLANGDASRRHAEIRSGSEGFVLRDLDSTNGTYVNGKRIQEIALEPGDRIEIGSSEIRFCHVNPGLSESDAASDPLPVQEQTLVVERPALQVFEGDLSEIPPFAVLQILEMGRKTGTLRLDTGQGSTTLWFQNGRPVHAESKRDQGFDAALTVIHATTGRFAFEPVSRLPEATIEASVTELLLESSRMLDEGMLEIPE